MPAQVMSARAAYAQHALHRYLLKKSGKTELPELKLTPHRGELDGAPAADPLYTGRICIVGAGACGLYLAMMLKYLGYGNVDILEASDRVGGRCFTYPEPGDTETHSYYDVGAMRIPDIPWMTHVLKFTRETLGLKDSVVPYIYSNDDVPVCYNYQNKPITDDPFKALMKSFSDPFLADFDKAFDDWMKPDPEKKLLKDNFSTRAWLMLEATPPWTYDQVATAEIFDTSTGLFDQSLTETVIDYADFGAADSKPWWRVDGGIQTITDTMQSLLASPDWPPQPSPIHHFYPTLVTKTPVTAMALSLDEQTSKPCIAVTSASYADDPKNPITKTESYDIVFNTTAMPPLQRMDLSNLNLPPEIHTGIRTLSYDRATKVVIKFAYPWWNSVLNKPIYGGVSSSDLPISNVVYPSWNDGPDKPAVLMVSYSWAQDATRMGALVQDYSLVKPAKGDEILKLCIQNLAQLWADTEPKPTAKELMDLVVDDGSPCAPYHAWAWSHDPYTGGAFALFGPGQFQNVYPEFLGLQCNGHLALCGEALSAHHAWISGAWASAYMQLVAFLKDRGQNLALDRLTKSDFGGSGAAGGGKVGKPGGRKGDLDRGGDEHETRGHPHPEEMDESLLLHLLKLRQKEWGR